MTRVDLLLGGDHDDYFSSSELEALSSKSWRTTATNPVRTWSSMRFGCSVIAGKRNCRKRTGSRTPWNNSEPSSACRPAGTRTTPPRLIRSSCRLRPPCCTDWPSRGESRSRTSVPREAAASSSSGEPVPARSKSRWSAKTVRRISFKTMSLGLRRKGSFHLTNRSMWLPATSNALRAVSERDTRRCLWARTTSRTDSRSRIWQAVDERDEGTKKLFRLTGHFGRTAKA